MPERKCRSFIATRLGQTHVHFLKHSWMSKGNYQICVHCMYVKPMTKVFMVSWKKLEEALDKIK